MAAALGLLGIAWLIVGLLVEGAAWRAQRLGARSPWPGARGEGISSRPTKASGAAQKALKLGFLGDLQRGVVDVPRGLVAALETEPVDLLVSSGDFASHGEAHWFGLVHEAFERAGMRTPFAIVPGNHDLFPSRCRDDRIGGPVFERFHGARSWQRDLGHALLVGLDTGTMWRALLEWPEVQAWLDERPGKPWILVTHRPPWRLDQTEPTAYDDLGSLPACWGDRPPALYVCGHLHRVVDTVIDDVRYLVNARGGHVEGGLGRRGAFQLLRVDIEADGSTAVRTTEHRRQGDASVQIDRLLLRISDARRRPWLRILSAPARFLLRMLGRAPLFVVYPTKRAQPTREEAAAWLAEARAGRGTQSKTWDTQHTR